MNREELIAYDKWLTRRKWGTGEIISPEKAADIYLAEHPLPPAEGAEAIKQALCDDIKKSLNGAYLDKIFDSEQNSLPLVDYLSAAIPGNTIASGKKEIENIVEQIYFDMEEWQSLALLQQQPTVEGAEEILEKGWQKQFQYESDGWKFSHFHDTHLQWVIAAMQEFATLHAQRIAEKMVSERLRGELIAYEEHEYFTRHEFAEITIDEYLKTREK